METNEKTESKHAKFVQLLFEQIAFDKGFRASLRAADNPGTEYMAWPVLIRWGVDVTKSEKDAYCLIAAAAARSSAEKDGEGTFGKTLAQCFEAGRDDPGAASRMQRLLGCDSVSEACQVLRPMLRLIQSKNPGQLSFARLLEDLVRFQWDSSRERVKERWAMDFYARAVKEEEHA